MMPFTVLGSEHIVPICFEHLDQSLACSNKLKQSGFMAFPIRPPTVAANQTRVRFSLCSTHTTQQLKWVCDVIRP